MSDEQSKSERQRRIDSLRYKDEDIGINVTQFIDEQEQRMMAAYQAEYQRRQTENPGSEKQLFKPSFFAELLRLKKGVNFNLSNDEAALGDRLIGSAFFRALEIVIHAYPELRPNDAEFAAQILVSPMLMSLFSRGERKVDQTFQQADAFPRDSENLEVSTHYVLGGVGLARAEGQDDPSRFPLYMRHELKNGQNTNEVEYGGALLTFPFDQYGERRYIIAAAMALGVPESEWDSLPTVIPEILSATDEELGTVIERFQINPDAINIGIAVNSGMKQKMIKLEEWNLILQGFGMTYRRQHPETADRPIHFNFFYNPNNPGVDDFSAEQLREVFKDEVTFPIGMTDSKPIGESRYVGGSLAELPALLEIQDILLSTDTFLAHAAAALEYGPQVVMLFNDKVFSQNVWISTAKQHPVSMDGTHAEKMRRLALQFVRGKIT